MTRSSIVLTAITLALGGCTFNVETPREVVSASTETSPTLLRADFRTIGTPFGDSSIVVTGADRTGAEASVEVAGLLPSGEDFGEVTRGVRINFDEADDGATDLSFGYVGPFAENVWVEEVALEVPTGTDLELRADSASVDVADVNGSHVLVQTTSGSIRLRGGGEVDLEADSGSIDVVGREGTLLADSGSIDMQMTGPVIARCTSGSINGTFGGHGEMTADSGSIDVELTTDVDGDIVLRADSGSINVIVPRGTAVRLDLDADSGSVSVNGDDVDHEDGGHVGQLNGGGTFTLHASADSGSVSVVEK